MTPKYFDALDASRAATPAFSAARSAFAAGRITADELHAARAAFNLARANFVAIHNAETAAAPYTVKPRTALVRRGFGMSDVWADGLGQHSIDGPLDAPVWIPTGSTAGEPPRPVMTHRDEN